MRRKPDALVIHTGTNDLLANSNTMKKVRNLVISVQEVDGRKESHLGSSSIINRTQIMIIRIKFLAGY